MIGWASCRPEISGSRTGREYTYLLTEGFRLLAIKTYLRLGSESERTGPSHLGRWQSLREKLPTES